MKLLINWSNKIWQLLRFRLMKLSLHHRLVLMMVVIVSFSVLLVGLVTYQQASNMVKKQTAAQTLQQLHQSSTSLQNYYSEILELATFIISDDRIQNYMSSPDESDNNSFDEVFRTLSYFQNTKRGISYMYVHKDLTDRIVYVGPSKSGRALDSQLKGMLSELSPEGGNIGLRILGPMQDPIEQYRWSFLIFQQLNDLYRVQDKVGTLGISITENSLNEQYQSSDGTFDMTYMIINSDHVILSHRDKDRIGQTAAIDKAFTEPRGAFELDNQLLAYEYVSDWDFYLVGMIPMETLLKDNRILVLEVLIAMSAAIILAIMLAFLFSRQITRPFAELLDRMNKVSAGNWDQTIDLSKYGNEFATVSKGFSTMTTRIRQLLGQIVREQRQLQEIELKALHAQIKPHFLYNTLDSIHWLAAVNHQEDISTIVKALAGFYRICLSQGRDMITLKTELEHVEHYLTIQKIRYSDLFEYQQSIPDSLTDIMLPKMTLQPIVENSIYHGLRKKGQPGRIIISAHEIDNVVSIDIEDNGIGMKADQIAELNKLQESDDSHSYGLRNVHQRLLLTFGQDYGLVFRANSHGGLTVTVRIPKKGSVNSNVLDLDS